MDIRTHAYGNLRFSSRTATVLTDPISEKITGYPRVKTDASVVLLSHKSFDYDLGGITDNPMVISGPGEYEVKDVSIRGFLTKVTPEPTEKRTLYHLMIEDISILYCGLLDISLDDAFLGNFSDIDILCVPVGGHSVLSPSKAHELINKIEPRIVIPTHFKESSANKSAEIESIEAFVKEMGKEAIPSEKKFSVKKTALPEELQIVILEP